jgi:hypothetical protein
MIPILTEVAIGVTGRDQPMKEDDDRYGAIRNE